MKAPKFFKIDAARASEYEPEVFAFRVWIESEAGETVRLNDAIANPRSRALRIIGKGEPIRCLAEFDFRQGLWSDMIFVGSVDDPLVLVSERVVIILESEAILGCKALRVETKPEQSAAYLEGSGGAYFALPLVPGIAINVEREGVSRTGMKPPPTRFMPNDASWAGFDLFHPSNEYKMLCCCTLKIIELAHKYRWTNFKFTPLDAPRETARRWSGIDYLGPLWPPEQWYPE